MPNVSSVYKNKPKSFKSLDDFSEFLSTNLIPEMLKLENNLTEKVASKLADNLDKEIGLKLPGIPNLAESTIDKKAYLGTGLNGDPTSPGYEKGYFKRCVSYKMVAHGKAKIGTELHYILYYEMGTRTQPPRPIFWYTIRQSKNDVKKIATKELARYFGGK